MENKAITLNSLEADVAELQAIVRNLGCQEKTFKKALIRCNTINLTEGTKSAKHGNKALELCQI